MFARSPYALSAYPPRAHGASRTAHLRVPLVTHFASNFAGAANTPTEIGTGYPNEGAQGGPHEGRGKTHQQGGARAVDQAREQIAAEGIGAQPVRQGGRAELGGKVRLQGM